MPIGGFQFRLNKMHVYDKRSSSDYATTIGFTLPSRSTTK